MCELQRETAIGSDRWLIQRQQLMDKLASWFFSHSQNFFPPSLCVIYQMSLIIQCYVWVEKGNSCIHWCASPLSQSNVLWKCEFSHGIRDRLCVLAHDACGIFTHCLTWAGALLAAAGELTSFAASSIGCDHLSKGNHYLYITTGLSKITARQHLQYFPQPVKRDTQRMRDVQRKCCCLKFNQLFLLFQPEKPCHSSYLFLFHLLGFGLSIKQSGNRLDLIAICDTFLKN